MMISKLKVGGYVYNVAQVRELLPSDDDLINDTHPTGEIEYANHSIRIAGDACEQHRESALLHEAIHAIEEQFRTGLTEAQVSALEHGLYQVLVDNPKFTQMFIYRNEQDNVQQIE
jgi:hypothetical protein